MIDFENLTDEQIERAKACETAEDILAFAADEGYELSDEELDAINGGMKIMVVKSPKIASPFLRFIFRIKKPEGAESAAPAEQE